MNTLPDNRLVTLHTGAAGVRTALAGSFKSADTGTEPVLTFIGSDESVDRYGDVVRQAGLKLDNFRRNPVVPDCHDYSSIARILGTCDSVVVKDGRLVNQVRFALDNPLGALAYKMAKAGHIRAQSIGFLPQKYQALPGSQNGYEFTESELLEISLVVVPANANAVAEMRSALHSGAINQGDLGNVIEMLRSLEIPQSAIRNPQSEPLSQTKQTPATPDPAPGGKAPVPDWLPSLRALVAALKTK
jgi:HK97 family phage prohead protease